MKKLPSPSFLKTDHAHEVNYIHSTRSTPLRIQWLPWLICALFGSNVVFAEIPSPSANLGLVLRIEADAGTVTAEDGRSLKRWSDLSGRGNHLFAGGNPTLEAGAAPSGAPAVRMDGVDDLLERTYRDGAITGFPTGNADRTVFMVASYQSNTWWSGFSYGSPSQNEAYGLHVKYPTGELVLHGWGKDNDLVSNAAGVGADWLVQSSVLRDGDSALFKNGVEIARFHHTYATGNERIVLGQEIANLGFAEMDVAAVLVFDRALSNADREQVEAYLQEKYIGSDNSDVSQGNGDSESTEGEEGGPDKVVLFDGRSLNGLSVWSMWGGWLDQQDIFTVQNGLLHVADDVPYASLLTDQSYENYRMTLEFKWGSDTYGNRAGKARDAGLLLHSRGAAGGWRGQLMPNIEVQVMEGSTGDFILLKGDAPMRMTANVGRSAYNDTWNYRGGYRWLNDGETRSFSDDLDSVHWFGWDPDWRDVAGYRGSNDIEKPRGEWNRIVVVADGDRLEVFLNGIKVNEAFNVYPTSGRIQLESEQAEYYVRRWELEPLP